MQRIFCKIVTALTQKSQFSERHIDLLNIFCRSVSEKFLAYVQRRYILSLGGNAHGIIDAQVRTLFFVK